MSAESPRRGMHKGAQIISPQPIVDRSIIDSVAGIINDIVPQVCNLIKIFSVYNSSIYNIYYLYDYLAGIRRSIQL